MILKKKYISRSVIVLFVLIIITRYTAEFLGINLLTLILLTAGYVLLLLLTGKLNLIKFNSWISIVFLIIIIYIPVTLLWTDSIGYGIDKIVLFYSLFSISIIITPIILDEFNDFKKIYSLFFFIVIMLLLFNGALSRITLTLTTGKRFYLEQDALNSSVTIGNFLGFSILLVSSNFKKNQSSFYRLFLVLLLVLGTIFLFFTGSRGPLFALICSPIIYSILASGRKSVIIFLLLFLLLIFFSSVNSSFIYNITPTSLHSFVDLRYYSEEATGSIAERFDLYNKALKGMFTGNLFEILLGHGIGDFSHYFSGSDKRLYPHNLFMEIGYEYGILSLLGFIILNVKVILFNINRSKNEINIWLFILYYFTLIRSLFSEDLAGNFLVFTFLFYILIFHNTKKTYK